MAVVAPGVEWRRNSISSARIDPRWIIIHTIVGTVTGSLSGRHYHIYVRANGTAVQIQDLALRSAASVEANPYSIAITFEDMGPAFGPWSGNNVPPLTKAQVDTAVRIIAWICVRFGIPPEYALSSCLNSGRGIRWHRLGIDGNFPSSGILRGRVPGCQRWSSVRGKGCPGDRRIRQIVNEILPRVRAVLGKAAPQPTKPPAKEWDEMATKKEIQDAVREVVRDEVRRAIAGRPPHVLAVREGHKSGDPVFLTDLASWKLEIQGKGPLHELHKALARLDGRSDMALRLAPEVLDAIPTIPAQAVDPAAVARELAALRPDGPDGAVVEAALRRVFADAASG